MRTLRVRLATKRRTINTSTYGHTHTLLHRVVVGIQVQGKSLIDFPDGERWGDDPRVDVRVMPADFAERLDAFVRSHYVRNARGYNCYSFMRYTTGLEDGTIDMCECIYTGPVIPTLQTEPYQPYAMYKGGTRGECRHGIVGFTNTVCINVLGNNQPLAIAPTAEVMKVYDCDTLIKVVDHYMA